VTGGRAAGAHLWMLSRKHPPSVGGMQQLSWHLVQGLRARRAVTAITWGGGAWALPFWFAWAQCRLAFGLARGRIAVLHLGDPALAALAWLPRRAGVPVFATVHGLDLVHAPRAYQAYLARFFDGRMRACACISRHVRTLLLARRGAPALAPVIPVGIDPPPAAHAAAMAAARESRAARGDAIELLFVGRLVERKGVAWFLDAVAPAWFARHPRARLRIAGDGPERARIAASLRANALEDRVELLGAVDEARKWSLLASADLVLMPNIPVAGDAEGFGLVCLEAGSAGTWVLASDLEGLRDAVITGVNGDRVPAGDALAWIARLDALCADPAALRAQGEASAARVAERFGWPAVIDQYEALVEALLGEATRAR
jgi:phosphatidylinositol alpha-1,6-mannosyltransferase